MTTGTTNTVFLGYRNTSTVVLKVDFGYTAPNLQFQAGLVNTGTTWTMTRWYTLTKATHTIEFDWKAATIGSLTFWIDGVQKANLTGVNNSNRAVDMTLAPARTQPRTISPSKIATCPNAAGAPAQRPGVGVKGAAGIARVRPRLIEAGEI